MAQWMNDVCGAFQYKGWYHLFYQFGPFHDDAPRLVGWGHARSRDLVHWEILPEAVYPDPGCGELLYGSGSAVVTELGIPTLFYAWTPDGVWEGRGKREQRAALPVDDELMKWRKFEIGLRPGECGVPADIRGSWADMFVFRADGRTFATFKAADGLLCEARNPELTRWQAVGRIDGIEGECPNFFPLEGKFVLLESTYPISYQIGRFESDALKFVPESPRRTLDYGYGPEKPHNLARGIYGTTVTTDESGRTLFLGWVSGFESGRGWNGCMGLPRELTIDTDGYLIQTAVGELKQLRGEHTVVKELTLTGDSRALEEASGDTLELKATFRPTDARASGLRLSRGKDGTRDIVIVSRGSDLDVAGTVVPRVCDHANDPIELHIFLDRSVLEVFINGGRQTVTKVVQAELPEAQVALFADKGSATFHEVDVWRLKPVWPQ